MIVRQDEHNIRLIVLRTGRVHREHGDRKENEKTTNDQPSASEKHIRFSNWTWLRRHADSPVSVLVPLENSSTSRPRCCKNET